MLNRYPLWKYLLIIISISLAAIYAAPNLFGEDPALQISPLKGQTLDEKTVKRIERQLKKDKISYFGLEQKARQLLLRFPDADTQISAQAKLLAKFGDNYTIALNLAPATPEWLKALNASPMKLGLDLRGGVHFLLEVDTEDALTQRYNSK